MIQPAGGLEPGLCGLFFLYRRAEQDLATTIPLGFKFIYLFIYSFIIQKTIFFFFIATLRRTAAFFTARVRQADVVAVVSQESVNK